MIEWRCITGEQETAAHGLAGDEFLMTQYSTWAASDCPDPILRLYSFRNHCILLGRFQNLEAEVQAEECRKLGVDVNRRITGGGAVIMGADQLMIALASSVEHPAVPSHPARILPKMARGIIAGLEELGLEAEYRPKNDVVVNGRKIAGTGMCVEETGAFLFQASVILDFDMALMLKTLRLTADKISDKQISSFSERITTIERELDRPVEMHAVRDAIRRGFERAFKMSASNSAFAPEELAEIEHLEREKYRSEAWINQRMPTSDMIGEAIRKTRTGLIHAYVALSGPPGRMKSVLITGDFFSGDRVINDIEAGLKWGRTDRDSILRVIRGAMSSHGRAVYGLDPGTLADVIHDAVNNAASSPSR